MQEPHDRWSYHQSGMGPVTALVVSVVAAAVAAPVAAQAGAAAGGSAAAAGMGATTSAGVSGAVQMGVNALASRAAVSLANNDGDLGKVLEELGSSESVKAIATAMLTAGVIDGLGNTITMDVDGVATPLNQIKAINGAGSFQVLGRNLIHGTARALVDSAINGASLEDSLTRSIATAFIDTGAALGASSIGANTAPGSFANFAGHLIAGCAAGALRADRAAGCGAGAIGATLGEATALALNGNRAAEDILANGLLPGTSQMASLVGGLGVALAGGDASLVHLGAGAGSNAAENNMAGQITMLAQSVVRFNQAGWHAVSAAGQVAILRCAANNWCASLPLMAAAVGHVNSAQFAANQPSLADQIPTGYGAGGVLNLDGSTITSANVMSGANATTTPGTALNNPGAPGYSASDPTSSGAPPSVANDGPLSGIIMMATLDSIRQRAQDVIDYADAHKGASRPGYVGGRTFNNDGRGGGQLLPAVDVRGNPITYTEYDANRFTPGVNRGAERVVIGGDGSAYYTDDHYATFVRLR
ncbi:ribonuclease [Variovorax sp. WDL1]|nr:hypothetical protein CHC07_05265 [Variovorax sp. B4]PNG55425.1 hypothetical protein CHC06_04228 [Variovorax sp. B2]VTV09195.1 ribonuclease [Variovorax sp. WDL1]